MIPQAASPVLVETAWVGPAGATRLAREGGVGAMEEGGDLLELFGSDLETHRQSPAWNRGSILPPAVGVHPVF